MTRQRGFTLIELMVALVVGLLVSAAALGMFASASRSANFNDGAGELRRDARFALEQISRRARSAGFAGCLDPGADELALSVASPPMNTWQAGVIGGALIGATGWSPAAPAGFTPPTDPAPRVGTHALYLQGGEGRGRRLLQPMSTPNDPLQLEGGVGDFTVGELVVISDCGGGDLFQVASVSANAAGISLQPTQALSRRYVPRTLEPGAVQAVRYRADIWYVADSGRLESDSLPVHSLYLQSWPYTAANPPLEMAVGIEAMSLSFGVMDDAGLNLRERQPASGVDVERIARVELALLAASRDGIVDTVDDTSYVLAGREVSAPGGGGALEHGGRRQLRQVYETTVQLRSRLK